MTEIPYGKNLVIKELEEREFEEESVERMEEALEGKEVPAVVSFDNPEKIREMLTEKRLELMKKIMTEEAESITDLADKLDRDIKDVHSDLELLEKNNIVFFEEKGRKKKPVVPYKDIKVDYSLTDSLMKDRLRLSCGNFPRS